MFDQICGVLSVLGADEPVAALRSVQESVRKFADPNAPAQAEEFARIAGNLGAVGFFIESMGQDIDRPRGMFHFDPATGIFSADLTQQPASATADNDETITARIPEPHTLCTVTAPTDFAANRMRSSSASARCCATIPSSPCDWASPGPASRFASCSTRRRARPRRLV